MLKTFLNNKIILGILPLIHENKFIIEFKENEILNNFFMKQLSTVISLQLLKRKQRSPFQQITLINGSLKTVQNFGSSRVHVKNIVRMHMVKLYDTPIC